MDLRRRILDTSLKLIGKKGLDALSMREVSRRLKVTHGAPYYHFKDRSSIVAVLVEEGFDRLTACLDDAARSEKNPRAAFEACGRAYVTFAVQNSAAFRIMFRPELTGTANREAIDVAAARSFAVLVAVVDRCQQAGLAKRFNAESLALTGWSTAHGLASLVVDGPLASKGDSRLFAYTVGATLGGLLDATRVKRRRR